MALFLPLFLFSVLRLPAVQSFIVHKVAENYSKKLGTEVSIGSAYVDGMWNVVINDLKINDKHHEPLVSIHKMKAGLGVFSMRKRQLEIRRVSLYNAGFNLKKYASDSSMNIQFLVDYFSGGTQDTSASKPWKLKLRSLTLHSSSFSYINEDDTSFHNGINYSGLGVSELEMDIKYIVSEADSINAELKNISFQEKSGFILNEMSALVHFDPHKISLPRLKINTPNSDLDLDYEMQFNDFNAFNHFIDSVKIVGTLRESDIGMKDIVFFAPEIEGMQDHFYITGKMKGYVSSFDAKELDIRFGTGSHFRGKAKVNGLPDIYETFANIKADDLTVIISDLKKFSLPVNTGLIGIPIPKELDKFGTIIASGRFTGFYNDFVSNASFRTDAGTLVTDILLTNSNNGKNISYDGHLVADEFNVGKIFDIREIGKVSIDAKVNGSGTSADDADLTIKGALTHIGLLNNQFNKLDIDGKFVKRKFTGKAKMDDPLLAFTFDGLVDMSDSLPYFNFTSDIAHAYPAKLHLWERDSTGIFATHMELKFKGINPDLMMGSMYFENTSYNESGKSLKIKDINIETQYNALGDKQMVLQSDIIDGTITGDYSIQGFAGYITKVASAYLPAIQPLSDSKSGVPAGKFTYDFRIKSTKHLTDIFVPSLYIEPNSTLAGEFDPEKDNVTLKSSSRLVNISGISFNSLRIDGYTEEGRFNLDLSSDVVDLYKNTRKNDTTNFRLDKFALNAVTGNNLVNLRLTWDDPEVQSHNKGNFQGIINFEDYPLIRSSLNDGDMLVNDTLWKILPQNKILFDTTSTLISNLGFSHHDQLLEINGILSKNPLDILTIELKDFDISNFDVLTNPLNFDIDGRVSGNVMMNDLFNVPLVTSNISINAFGFNNEKLGDAEIKSHWNNEQEVVDVNVDVLHTGNYSKHYPLLAKGKIYPMRKENNFDIHATVDNVQIKVIEPFLSSVFSGMRGWASGSLNLGGSFNEPELTGSLKMMRAETLVNIIGVTYSFKGDVLFEKDKIILKDLPITDSMLNTGIVNAEIRHHVFRDWYLDINVATKDLYALNTAFNPREMYYGVARGTGNLIIKGPAEDLTFKVDISTSEGTDVVIPITYAVSLSDNDFVTYVNQANTQKILVTSIAAPPGINLDFNFNVNNKAGIRIILPYRMGDINVKGNGKINLGVDTRGDYSMHGVYTMEEGTFKFSLQDIFSKNFSIQKGGTIRFNGSPYDADINLQAVYKIKTSLSSLPQFANDPEYSSRRIPVDCIIALNNDLYNPDIKFSIALPDVDDQLQRKIFSQIDTNNSVAMNQQMISLLVLGSFVGNNEPTAVTTSNLASSSFDILNNQINSWLSQISKDFDIGVNYRPGDQLSPQELELALSTQLFNNRVSIDGTFGVNGDSPYATGSQNTSSRWVGDINVEFKVTDDGRFRVKAFNRSNTTLDMLTGQSQYTQGVGVVYRKDFDYLFRTKKEPENYVERLPDSLNR